MLSDNLDRDLLAGENNCTELLDVDYYLPYSDQCLSIHLDAKSWFVV